MIDHIVLLRWKADAGAAAKADLAASLAALAGEVPGIVRYAGGAQGSPEGKGHDFEWGFVMTFTDAAARDAYLPHPEHQRVVGELLAPIVQDALVFDFEHPE